jgi:hypothetical protein
MKRRPPATTLRRSAALPPALIGELDSVARRRRQEFAGAVAAMAVDPQIRAECAAIARDFAATEMDGLGNDQARSGALRLARSRS